MRACSTRFGRRNTGARRPLFWPSRVEARVPYKSSFQHVACRQAFGLSGGKVGSIAPRRAPSAIRQSPAFPASREASVGAAMGA
jgi:hypothetical protein